MITGPSTGRATSLLLGIALAVAAVAAGFVPSLDTTPVAAGRSAVAVAAEPGARSATDSPPGVPRTMGAGTATPGADQGAPVEGLAGGAVGGMADGGEDGVMATSEGATPTASPALPPTPAETLADAVAATGIQASVAAITVLDPAAGRLASWGDPRLEITASIVKVDILASLLLQRQDSGRRLSTDESAMAAEMITESDNDAATSLWDEIGGGEGLSAANERLGLTDTVPGSGGYWGLTETTPDDQIRLLTALTSATSVLDASSRAYVLTLMAHVDPDQAWGVSAAGQAALKNGWLDRPDGSWAVNSIGIVTTPDGRTLLMAVQSHGWDSMEAGVSAVEQLAVAAVRSGV